MEKSNSNSQEPSKTNEWDELSNIPETEKKAISSSEMDPKKARLLGAKVLSSINFQDSYKEIIESSFQKALRRGDKLLGTGNDRRNMAYLDRLEKIKTKYGERGEDLLWQMSAQNVIIKPENISEKYWQEQEQIYRNRGMAHKMSSEEKQLEAIKVMNTQLTSLKPWIEELKKGDYPTTFKVWAWEGMSRMGIYDSEKGVYTKRDKTTVYPFPTFDQKAFQEVYKSYQNQEKRGFNELYSNYLIKDGSILRTPEKTEDVRGNWVIYSPGQEQEVAHAAIGTPWCIKDPGTAKNYLEGGDSGADEHSSDSKAKFYLFHLQDPKTGEPSERACASIRLDTNGKVAEISGLKKDQVLESSLIPIVEQKTLSLPGGKEFLKAFEDNKILTAIDKKASTGEPLTKSEIEFVYEVKHPIKTLNNQPDSRIDDIRASYGVEYALSQGIKAKKLLPNLSDEEIVGNLSLLASRIPIKKIVGELSDITIVENLDSLVENGVKVGRKKAIDTERLKENLNTTDLLNNFKVLNKYGANINIDSLISSAQDFDKIESFDRLIEQGVKIDLNSFVLDSLKTTDHVNVFVGTKLDKFIQLGGNVEALKAKLSEKEKTQLQQALANHGVVF